MRVVVTGAGGHLAKALLPALCAQTWVSRVTGIDISPMGFAHAKFRAVRLSIGHPDIGWALRGHDALVNLAFRVLRGKMSLERMQDVNLRNQQHLFKAATDYGCQRLIHLSSAAVYGSGSALREDAPFQPLPGFAYAEQKASLESWLAENVPQCVRLRPHIILGPHSLPLLKQLLRSPFYVRLPDPQPPLQCIHEDDVVAAIIACLRRPVGGAFNLASNDTFTLQQVARGGGRKCFAINKRVAQVFLKLLWRWRGWGGEPGWFAGIDRPLTLDCTRARESLEWNAQYSAAQAIEAARE